MPAQDQLRFRAAERGDAAAIAALHAASWRRHYRGAFSDAFLDGEVAGFLLDTWTTRLAAPDPLARTILAELRRSGDGDGDRALVGMAHTVLDDDSTWGALLDNLHVAHGLKRHGLGTRLLSLTARAVIAARPGSGLYLWVFEQNDNARAFYEARGGTFVESRDVRPPADDPARLNGRPKGLRYAWPDPARLLKTDSDSEALQRAGARLPARP
jgi:ribosomal protein S18 acetylase RimI-like enzyme